MDSEGIIHFSFFFYALMKGRIATISFGCLCAVEERRNHRVYDMSGFSYDITDVVHLLQLRVRHKNSSSMDVNCPFCGETKWKMNVNLQKNVFRCNRCDASGGMLELHGRLHGVSSAEANRQIREALGKGEYRTDYQVVMQNYFSKQENVQVEEETEEDVIEKQKISEFVLAPEVAKSVRDARVHLEIDRKRKKKHRF